MALTAVKRKTTAKKGFVTIPRKEYEEFLQFKKIRSFIPTKAQKRDLIQARKDFTRGEYVTLAELRHDLERRRSRKGA